MWMRSVIMWMRWGGGRFVVIMWMQFFGVLVVLVDALGGFRSFVAIMWKQFGVLVVLIMWIRVTIVLVLDSVCTASISDNNYTSITPSGPTSMQ